MKTPIWDDCENYSATHDYKLGDKLKPNRLIQVGMTATAFHSGDRVEIKITRILKDNADFAGTVVRIHTDGQKSGDLALGEEVAVPIHKICHIDQNIT
jgi:hypothetical protein